MWVWNLKWLKINPRLSAVWVRSGKLKTWKLSGLPHSQTNRLPWQYRQYISFRPSKPAHAVRNSRQNCDLNPALQERPHVVVWMMWVWMSPQSKASHCSLICSDFSGKDPGWDYSLDARNIFYPWEIIHKSQEWTLIMRGRYTERTFSEPLNFSKY